MNANTANSNSHLARDFLGLFFPRYCLGCEDALVKGEEVLCSECLSQLPKANDWLEETNPVRMKFAGRMEVQHAFAFLKFRKSGLVQHLLHQLKYNNHPEVGQRLGAVFAHELAQRGFVAPFDCLVPVPLHRSRQRSRGYNQSTQFALGLASVWKVPVSESISVRKTRTQTQTRKNRWQRWENVRAVFDVAPTASLAGKHVLLVDDVITTGATLEACGGHLWQAGCAQLSIACIAAAQ
ncbi:MAG: ComF family protein [Cyclobacteriaceae bacterium]|jgi:ComF family protein|nr:ComF family protein [Cyclobacteriaceae bacterium]